MRFFIIFVSTLFLSTRVAISAPVFNNQQHLTECVGGITKSYEDFSPEIQATFTQADVDNILKFCQCVTGIISRDAPNCNPDAEEQLLQVITYATNQCILRFPLKIDPTKNESPYYNIT